MSEAYWVIKSDGVVWWWECSKCGEEPLKNKWSGDDALSSYCPNCGAKMKIDERGISEYV